MDLDATDLLATITGCKGAFAAPSAPTPERHLFDALGRAIAARSDLAAERIRGSIRRTRQSNLGPTGTFRTKGNISRDTNLAASKQRSRPPLISNPRTLPSGRLLKASPAGRRDIAFECAYGRGARSKIVGRRLIDMCTDLQSALTPTFAPLRSTLPAVRFSLREGLGGQALMVEGQETAASVRAASGCETHFLCRHTLI
jgi:hypothetical protein